MADFDRGGKAFAIILFIVAIAGDRVVIPAVGRRYRCSCPDVISDLPAGRVQANVETVDFTLRVTHVVFRIRVCFRGRAKHAAGTQYPFVHRLAHEITADLKHGGSGVIADFIAAGIVLMIAALNVHPVFRLSSLRNVSWSRSSRLCRNILCAAR